ncbi:DNA polymerase delta subunit 4 [Pelodiscus sinensis]|uniref:DNA polymerase delta subunit 4 n=1 Tax=Pelodiscus sinensis TaxID=13735 RepID=UPI0003C49CCC|nr:DNA polymerase delta subunit 4 [Pelodiscus sinensis]|eukprot:XP_006113806.1 DNA polymerase delta subunit 4 [Pelodiscus sinensis]
MGRKRLITDSFPVVKKQRQDPDTKLGSLQPEAAPDPPDSHPGGSLYPAPLEMLRQFDLSWEYGPCTGITRLQRWERAKSLGLSPPVVVLETLLEHEGDPSFTHCLWHAYPL